MTMELGRYPVAAGRAEASAPGRSLFEFVEREQRGVDEITCAGQ